MPRPQTIVTVVLRDVFGTMIERLQRHTTLCIACVLLYLKVSNLNALSKCANAESMLGSMDDLSSFIDDSSCTT